VNLEVAAMVREAVVAEADGQTARRPDGQDEARRKRRILDLYAGAGDTALPLAALGHDVTLVELDRRSVTCAERLAAEKGLSVRCIAGRVEDHLGGLLPADVVIVNPPRTGLSESVTYQLGVLPSYRLVYVSCNPATLARDLKRLGATSNQVRVVRAFDMFPQTSHVETVVVLEPE
jgi:23S rRNA (uracil1939-C5)-methyltransferase